MNNPRPQLNQPSIEQLLGACQDLNVQTGSIILAIRNQWEIFKQQYLKLQEENSSLKEQIEKKKKKE